MYQVIIVFHVLFGLAIIGLVLMQQGKGADAGAAFGAGASGTVFGAQGAASFLSRTTAIFATLFFLTSLGLAIYNSHSGVAYDLMSDKATENDALNIPEADIAKTADKTSQALPGKEELPIEKTKSLPGDQPTTVEPEKNSSSATNESNGNIMPEDLPKEAKTLESGEKK